MVAATTCKPSDLTRLASRPLCITKAAASSRECTSSLPKMFWMCVLAVCGLMTRDRAIESLS